MTLQRGRRLETTERRASRATSKSGPMTLQRGRRLETTERATPCTRRERRAAGFNGAVVWRRRRVAQGTSLVLRDLGMLQRGRRLETTERPVLELPLGRALALASTGPSSGDDGERRYQAPEGNGPPASTGPSSGDDGEQQPVDPLALGLTGRASTGPSSGDDGETSRAFRDGESHCRLQRGRRLETTESAHPAFPRQCDTSGFNGAVVWRRRRGIW